MKNFIFAVFGIYLNFLLVLSAATDLYRSYDGILPAQTCSYAFRVSGRLHGQEVRFDIFGSYHSMPFKAYHPTL